MLQLMILTAELDLEEDLVKLLKVNFHQTLL
jgi:hypothetical protein